MSPTQQNYHPHKGDNQYTPDNLMNSFCATKMVLVRAQSLNSPNQSTVEVEKLDCNDLVLVIR